MSHHIITFSYLVITIFGIVRNFSAVSGYKYCYQQDSFKKRNYSTETPYDAFRTIRNDVSEQPYQTGPTTCRPIQMWFLARHGTKHFSRQKMQQTKVYLEQLQKVIMENLPYGSLCPEDALKLRSWRFRMRTEDADRLSQNGSEELKRIGERYRVKFPQILYVRYEEQKFDFRYARTSGNGEVTRDAAKAVAEGLFEFTADITFTEQSQPDFVLEPYNHCPKYNYQVNNGPGSSEYEMYKTKLYTQEMIRNIELKLGFLDSYFSYDDIKLVYDVCREEYALYGDSPWCALFSPEALRILEYGEDLRLYWESGYGNQINYQQTCPLLRDIFDNFQSALNNRGKLFLGRFGHSKIISTFLARLGLFRDSEPMHASDYGQRDFRFWKSTDFSPTSANIALVLSSCGSQNNQVQLFVNERPVAIPGCGINCPFDRFYRLFGNLALDCNLNVLCRNPVAMPTTSLGNESARVKSYSILVVFMFVLITKMHLV